MNKLLTKNIPFGKPSIGREEREAVSEVLKGPILVHGPKVKEFEGAFAAFTKAPHAISVSSCTAGLHLFYFHLNLRPGDEVIVPAQTHTATAHAIEFCGAKPVFVDAERKTGNIDLDQIENAITPRTKVISVVHYLGMPVNMGRLNKLAQKNKLFVVEDCALALGTYFKGVHAGLHGDVGCFSFYPVKHMTTAEGGMIITKQKKVADKISRQRAFGVDRGHAERQTPGYYDVTMLGFNYRMNEMEAALGIVQIKRMNDFLKKRKRNYEYLVSGLESIEEVNLFESSQGEYQSSYYCASILLKPPLAHKRSGIVQLLKDRGIGTSIYYPQPVPLFSYYKNKYGYKRNDFPVAEWISESSIALPVGPHLNLDDMKYIVNGVKNVLMEVR